MSQDAEYGAEDAVLDAEDQTDTEREQNLPAPTIADFDLDSILQDPRVKKHLDDSAASVRNATQRKEARKHKQNQQQPAPNPAHDLSEQIAQLMQKVDMLSANQTESALKQAWTQRGFNGETFEIAQKLHAVDQPADLGAWLDTLPSSITASTAPAPAAEVPQQRKAATPTPGSSPTATKRDYLGGAAIDPMTLTSDDIAHLRASGQYLQVLERWRTRANPPLHGRKRPK